MKVQATEQEANPPGFNPPGFSPELRGLMALIGRALGLPSQMRLDPVAADWDRFLRLADEHRVVPLVYAGLKASPEIALPAAVTAHLARRAGELWRRSLVFSEELGRLSRLFSGREIAMAAMKGPGLSVQAYGSDARRAMQDLDILIRPEDFRRAQNVLEAGGFVCEGAISRLSRAYQDIYLRSATHVSFQQQALGYCLEVHLRPFQVPSLFPVPTEALLASACPVVIGGTPVPVLAPHHHFLYVAAHGAKHGWWRLLWLADFAAFQQKQTGSAALTSPDLGLRRVLEAARNLCHLSFNSPKMMQGTGYLERDIHALVAHGIRCLERGRPPISYAEKWDELFSLLRLRPEPSYRWDVAKLYWGLTSADLDTLSQFASLSVGRFLPPVLLADSLPRSVPPYGPPEGCRRWLILG